MKKIKKGLLALTILGLLAVSCSSDDAIDDNGGGAGATEITNLNFTITTSGAGNIVSVLPSSSGATSYSVDFGVDSATDDVIATAGPAVSYTYPSEDTTYSITVTASATGADSVDLTKEVEVEIAVVQTPIVGRWVMSHTAAALYLGSADTQWWANGLGDVTLRSCLFDDVYEFKEDGSFVNTVGDSTWIETWHGTVTEEQCSAPVAPYDGTAIATWFHDQDAGTITISGKGAFLGLSKVADGPEILGPSEAAKSINYTNVVLSEDENTLIVEAHYTAAVDGENALWRFTLAREGSENASLAQTDTDGDGVIDAEDACPDFAGTEPNGCPTEKVGEDPADDFEGNGNIIWAVDATVIDTQAANPSVSGINTSDTVLQYVDEGEQWANIRFDLNEAKTDVFDLSTKNVFTLKVYVPTPDVEVVETKQLALKLQDGSSNEPWVGQVEVIQNYEYDVWQTLTFDFSGSSEAVDFSRVVLQFNSENNFEPVTAYIDDFTYGVAE